MRAAFEWANTKKTQEFNVKLFCLNGIESFVSLFLGWRLVSLLSQVSLAALNVLQSWIAAQVPPPPDRQLQLHMQVESC